MRVHFKKLKKKEAAAYYELPATVRGCPGKSDNHRGSMACNLARTSCCKSRGLKGRFWGVDVYELGLGERKRVYLDFCYFLLCCDY